MNDYYAWVKSRKKDEKLTKKTKKSFCLLAAAFFCCMLFCVLNIYPVFAQDTYNAKQNNALLASNVSNASRAAVSGNNVTGNITASQTWKTGDTIGSVNIAGGATPDTAVVITVDGAVNAEAKITVDSGYVKFVGGTSAANSITWTSNGGSYVNAVYVKDGANATFENITFDGGYDNNISFSKSAFVFRGTATLKNGVTIRNFYSTNGDGRGSYEGKKGVIAVYEKGVLNIEDGVTITNNTSGAGGVISIYQYDNSPSSPQDSTAVVNMYGGTIKDNKLNDGAVVGVVWCWCGKLNISGGTVTSISDDYAVLVQGLYDYYDATAVITGGTFRGDNIGAVLAGKESSNRSKITIKAGEFYGKTAVTANYGEINIEGGKYVGTQYALSCNNNSGLNVYGGEFIGDTSAYSGKINTNTQKVIVGNNASEEGAVNWDKSTSLNTYKYVAIGELEIQQEVASAKNAVAKELAASELTNDTTQENLQEKINQDLTKAGFTNVTATVSDFSKTDATETAEGKITCKVNIVSNEDGSISATETINKTIPMVLVVIVTEDEKVANAKQAAVDALAGIKAANGTTEADIQSIINEALTKAGITGVTVTVSDFKKTEATTKETGSITANIEIVSNNDENVKDSVEINKTIAMLPMTKITPVLTLTDEIIIHEYEGATSSQILEKAKIEVKKVLNVSGIEGLTEGTDYYIHVQLQIDTNCIDVRFILTDSGNDKYEITMDSVDWLSKQPITIHRWSREWTGTEEGHYNKCTLCDDKTSLKNHIFGGWQVVQDATYEKDGLKKSVCNQCKYERTAVIPMLVKTEAEKVAEAKKEVSDVIAAITATNDTTQEDLQKEINEALTKAGITDVTVTVGELTKIEATEEKAGSIVGSIEVVSKKDNTVKDSVAIEKTIDKLPSTKTEAEKVAEAKKEVSDVISAITATNDTTKEDLQKEINEVLTKAGITDVTVTVGELTKTEATEEKAGSIVGNIEVVSKKDNTVKDSVAIDKTIDKLPSTKTEAEKVAEAKKEVSDVISAITATNDTTKEELQKEINDALTKAGITDVTVTVGELTKTEATEEKAGSIVGSIEVVSKKDNTVKDSVAIDKTIDKLPSTKTEVEKVAEAKKEVSDVIAAITATNDTTQEDLQKEINEALTEAGITDVTVTVGELTKTEATEEKAGSIVGSIEVVSKKDNTVKDSVAIDKTIDKLPSTNTEAEKVAEAKKEVSDALAGITAVNGTTKEDLQKEIDDVLNKSGITGVTAVVSDVTKTEATDEKEGSISAKVDIVSKNDGSVKDNITVDKTISKLPKTDEEKVTGAKDTVNEALSDITAVNGTTKEDLQKEVEEALNKAGITGVTAVVSEVTKTEATEEKEGSISAKVDIVDKNDGSVKDSITVDKTISKLPKTDEEKVTGAKDKANEALSDIAVSNKTAKEDLQKEIENAINKAGITGVTVVVSDVTKTEATDEKEGSISVKVDIVSKNDGSVKDSITIDRTIVKLSKADTGNIEVDKEQGVNAPDADFGDSKDSVIDAVLTPEDQKLAADGTDIKIILTVDNIDASVAEADKQDIAEKIAENTETETYKVGEYLDINLYKLIGADRTKVSHTNSKIKIVLAIPDSLKNTDSNKTRSYAVVRVHDGVAEILPDIDSDEATITIETDLFSTYAIVYKDSAIGGSGDNTGDNDNTGDGDNTGDNDNTGDGGSKADAPNTGDTAPIGIYAIFAMASGLTYLYLLFGNRKRNVGKSARTAER